MKYGDVRYICEIFLDEDYFGVVEAKTIDDCVKEADHYVRIRRVNDCVTLRYYESREIVNLI